MPDPPTLTAEVAARVTTRSAARPLITWYFTLELARVRLAYVYPASQHAIIARNVH